MTIQPLIIIHMGNDQNKTRKVNKYSCYSMIYPTPTPYDSLSSEYTVTSDMLNNTSTCNGFSLESIVHHRGKEISLTFLSQYIDFLPAKYIWNKMSSAKCRPFCSVHNVIKQNTETEMLSFWCNFSSLTALEVVKWQLPVQPMMKISTKWQHVRFGELTPLWCSQRRYSPAAAGSQSN